MKLLAACAFGLESPVKWELQQLGYQPVVVAPGRVEFDGDWADVCKANLWLRVADRILIEVAQFEAADFDALFESTKAIAWQEWLPADAKFPVNARSRNSQLTSVPAIQRSCKKAIVESMMNACNTQTLPEDGPEYPIETSLLNNIATITLDTTGASLHKRGYRKGSGDAPIKETLAAAMVMLSVWNPERPLIDPFCGSGTIAIEAALIGRQLAPGRNRNFNWQYWPQVDSRTSADMIDAAQTSRNSDVELQILATDSDEQALKHARLNAWHAGVADDIHFQNRTFEDLRSKRKYGCVITNPPYGQRLGDRRNILPLYQSFPAVLQRLPTWSHFIITDLPDFEGLLRKSATRRRKLFNGRIECMYYQFLGPKPPSLAHPEFESQQEVHLTEAAPESSSNPPTHALEVKAQSQKGLTPFGIGSNSIAPVFGGLTEKDRQQAELFATRLQKRARHLRRWPSRRGITCYRVYERDIPELPFVVDRYENYFHVTEYERPHDRDPGRHASWLELMKKTVAKTFDVPIKNVYFKTRGRQSGADQHQKIESTDKRFEVQEGGIKFLVNLTDYVDTGLFLDHRETRKLIRKEAAGRNFLNLFAYTGSFSVYAAAGGAASTTTVDWSKTYLNWAQDNMRLNGFVGEPHQFRCADIMEFLDNIAQSKKFDLVVVDPPTFSNSKRTEEVWDIQANHVQLLQKVATVVPPGGTVYFSSNFRKLKFLQSEINGFEVMEISQQTVPEDFRNRKIHRCWKLTRV